MIYKIDNFLKLGSIKINGKRSTKTFDGPRIPSAWKTCKIQQTVFCYAHYYTTTIGFQLSMTTIQYIKRKVMKIIQ